MTDLLTSPLTSSRTGPLISLDVGGTLAVASKPGLAARLTALSPLPPAEARRVMRSVLHNAPEITEEVKRATCAALQIPVTSFPEQAEPSGLRLLPDAIEAVRELCQLGVVVTLSNVTCVEVDGGDLPARLHPWVAHHFASCRIGHSKPDRHAFLTAAERSGIPIGRMVHIGDDWECDILGATGVGAAAIWISHGRSIPGPVHPAAPAHAPGQASSQISGVLVADTIAEAVPHVRTLITRMTRKIPS